MLFKRLFFVYLLMIFSSVAVSDDRQSLMPVDEAERDLSFVEFRQQLREIVRNRDPESFTQFLSEDVYTGPERKRGIGNFISFWHPESVASDLWSTMDGILRLGGGFVRSEKGVSFCAPYVFTNFPDNLDIYGHGVVVGDEVPLKSAPVHTAKNLAVLSYDLLKVEDWRSVTEKNANKTINWIKVSTLAGRTGYVDKKMVRSPTDYAACFLFTPKAGWRLESLISGE